MELRSLAVFFGLCLLAVTQCSEARHAIERRDTSDDDIFSMPDAETQNDDNGNSDAREEEPEINATIISSPKAYQVLAGQNIALECKVNPDNGTVVQWFMGVDTLIYLGGMNMLRNSRYSLDSKDLIISEVKSSDGGKYRCVVAQTVPVSVEHTLEVLEKPDITRFAATNEGVLKEGEDLLLTCDTRGKPRPQIVWSRSSDDGRHNSRLEEKDGEFYENSVYIRNVNHLHSGKYYCYALNSIGSSQAELSVSVASKPHVRVHKTVVNSAINVEAVLQCSAHHGANPHFKWYKDSLEISDSSTGYQVVTSGYESNLTVTPQADVDFGTYTCEASNHIGKHNRSIELVQKPIVESLSSENGRLQWTIHSHQPLTDIIAQVHRIEENSTWQQFVVPLPSTSDHKYEVVYDLRDKVDAGTYEVMVTVKNDHSWSDAQEPNVFEIELEPQPIHTASVFGSNAHSVQSSTIVVPTILMYVFVRLL